MPGRCPIDVYIFEPITCACAGNIVLPGIAVAGLDSDVAACQQRRACYQRGVDFHSLTIRFTIKIKAKVVDFKTCLPLQRHDATVIYGAERTQVDARCRILIYGYCLSPNGDVTYAISSAGTN